jgi:hypothetical protein
MVHTLAMLTVVTPDGDTPHPDAETWTTTPDEHLVLWGPEDPNGEIRIRPVAEYARGDWRSVRREPEGPNAPQPSS